jgi:ribonuclease BN (tRNA processing enzyme)
MAQDLSQVQNIILTHLSDQNSDEARFVDEVKAITGKQMDAAKAGLTIDLTLKPF